MASQELQGSSLGAPVIKRLAASGGFQIAGQGLGRTHSPDAGGRADRSVDHSAVTGGEELRVAVHLKGRVRLHPTALGTARQSTGCQPGWRLAACAAQSWPFDGGFSVAHHTVLDAGCGDRLGQLRPRLPRFADQLQAPRRPALT